MKTPYGLTDSLVIGFEYNAKDSDQTYLMIARGNEVIARMDGEMAEDLYTILIGNEDWK